MASVDGEYLTTVVPPDFEGVEIRFNPKTHHLFVDSNNHAVRSADEVVVFGHRVYARGKITYHTPQSAPQREGNAPSAAVVVGEELSVKTQVLR